MTTLAGRDGSTSPLDIVADKLAGSLGLDTKQVITVVVDFIGWSGFGIKRNRMKGGTGTGTRPGNTLLWFSSQMCAPSCLPANHAIPL
jgi:hypothetical protein